MIIDYGDKDIIQYISCNEYMHNQPVPVFLKSTPLGEGVDKTLYTLTPYKTQKTERKQEVEKVVRKGLFGKKLEKHIVSATKFEPVENSKGFSFISTENRNITQTLCYIPYQDAEYNPKLTQYKKKHLVTPKPSVSSLNKTSYVLAQIGIDPELLMPMLSKQPKNLKDAIKLVHIDPRFLRQIDPKICKSDDDLELLYAEAKKGYNMVIDYQSSLGIDLPKVGSIEAQERQAYKTVCENYAKHFATAYLTNKAQQNEPSEAPLHA